MRLIWFACLTRLDFLRDADLKLCDIEFDMAIAGMLDIRQATKKSPPVFYMASLIAGTIPFIRRAMPEHNFI